MSVLFKDVKYWIENKTYCWDEIAARFHYHLVSIHIFSNGNGRHSRIMADLLLERNGQVSFTWGLKIDSIPLEVEGPIRKKYIQALKSADNRDFGPLLKFVRS